MSDIRHPEKINRVSNPIPKKPTWIRVKAPTSQFFKSKNKSIQETKIKTDSKRDSKIEEIIKSVVGLQYKRNDQNCYRGTVRARGEYLEMFPSH